MAGRSDSHDHRDGFYSTMQGSSLPGHWSVWIGNAISCIASYQLLRKPGTKQSSVARKIGSGDKTSLLILLSYLICLTSLSLVDRYICVNGRSFCPRYFNFVLNNNLPANYIRCMEGSYCNSQPSLTAGTVYIPNKFLQLDCYDSMIWYSLSSIL